MTTPFVTLELDKDTTNDLYSALYQLGEYIAAGTEIRCPTPEEDERLATVMDRLEQALGMNPPV